MLFGPHAEEGELGERLAAGFLKKAGLRILARNVRYPCGELDLVAAEGDEVVFVEVKARTDSHWGEPEEAVTPAKRRRVAKAALIFANRRKLRGHPLRFDVVSVIMPPEGEPLIRHYRDAFLLPRGLDV